IQEIILFLEKKNKKDKVLLIEKMIIEFDKIVQKKHAELNSRQKEIELIKYNNSNINSDLEKMKLDIKNKILVFEKIMKMHTKQLMENSEALKVAQEIINIKSMMMVGNKNVIYDLITTQQEFSHKIHDILKEQELEQNSSDKKCYILPIYFANNKQEQFWVCIKFFLNQNNEKQILVSCPKNLKYLENEITELVKKKIESYFYDKKCVLNFVMDPLENNNGDELIQKIEEIVKSENQSKQGSQKLNLRGNKKNGDDTESRQTQRQVGKK
ncbi:MAG: hypothetical protein ACD_72C00269G0001, partial [uncultured bacterium]